LHRRDYNAEPQILPNGDEGITMFSGVFQEDANLPFLSAVNIDSTSYTVQDSFQQYYNHYHCPVLPVYSEKDNEMHTVFFGGLAQFYDNSGTLVQDDNVPFVNTIARVTRTHDGKMAEYKDPLEMPALLGAGAEFIPNSAIPHYTNGVFKLDPISTDSTLIGYIFGGIESTQPNIFFINNGTQSSATSLIFKVYIKKPTISSVDHINSSQPNDLNVLIYPNPSKGRLKIEFILSEIEEVVLMIRDMNGQLLEKTLLPDVMIGKNVYEKEITQFSANHTYLLTLSTQNKVSTHQLIMQR
ncbi:MAG: T9SS type A sorting domain-containing protein, partial [Saprospiraceae bacterium]|nr:T9SS type A sorting domain-containing protein [Saprospiraceae bacterium]